MFQKASKAVTQIKKWSKAPSQEILYPSVVKGCVGYIQKERNFALPYPEVKAFFIKKDLGQNHNGNAPTVELPVPIPIHELKPGQKTDLCNSADRILGVLVRTVPRI